jgi:hypothetical protein
MVLSCYVLLVACCLLLVQAKVEPREQLRPTDLKSYLDHQYQMIALSAIEEASRKVCVTTHARIHRARVCMCVAFQSNHHANNIIVANYYTSSDDRQL